jgi:hypothetical protein
MIRAMLNYASVALPVYNGADAFVSAVNRCRILNGDSAGTRHFRLCLRDSKLLLASIVLTIALKRAGFTNGAEYEERTLARAAVRARHPLRHAGGTRRSAGSKT